MRVHNEIFTVRTAPVFKIKARGKRYVEMLVASEEEYNTQSGKQKSIIQFPLRCYGTEAWLASISNKAAVGSELILSGVQEQKRVRTDGVVSFITVIVVKNPNDLAFLERKVAL